MNALSFHLKDGFRRLYINGDLQFDERDERFYHEPLALLPVALARRRAPERDLRVLILGGGDGLALRDVLRFPEVKHVLLIDRDPDVLQYARTRWSDLNRNALEDPRVRILTEDARSVLKGPDSFDVILMDLTYPKQAESMPLFSLDFFQALTRHLTPEGILGLNAVSPEKTPAAFGCVARTLQEAGWAVLPYSIDLPSFREEGYGRWGFLFASLQPLGERELLDLPLPEGHALPRETLYAGLHWPLTDAFEAHPNRSTELRAYLLNPLPVVWSAPWGDPHFAPSTALSVPHMTVDQGFSNWLKEAEGSRTLQDLLECLPVHQQSLLREKLIEEQGMLEAWVRQVDWKTFVETALEKETAWPETWRVELKRWRDQMARASCDFEALLRQSYKVLAILLITLLLANLLFPDNLYAKGYSSHYSGGGAATTFSSTAWTPSPYHHRYNRGGLFRHRAYSHAGQSTEPLLFTAPAAALINPLALSASLQLLPDGAVAYATPFPTGVGHLTPGRFSLRSWKGGTLLELGLEPSLQDEIVRQIDAQKPLLRKARQDHERWRAWVGWEKWPGAGKEAVKDAELLESWAGLIERAGEIWKAPKLVFSPDPKWLVLMPGIYADSLASVNSPRLLILLRPGGEIEYRRIPALTSQDELDLFLLMLLQQAAQKPGFEAIKKHYPPNPPGQGAGAPAW
jgi:spermidine synthase